MSDFALSYVVNTRNKLPYLREAMKRLLVHVGDDEEVVVADGASTDGTVDYLRELYDAGKIHQLRSEPDEGEAHGWNRGLLLARGELIKLISDDDAFYFPGIRACRRLMLEHPEIDVLSTEGADSPWVGVGGRLTYAADYRRHLIDGRPFSFCGLGLMLRRRSLALTGLFNPGWLRIDHEFGLRLTHGPAKLAWYTGYTWVRITNPRSLTARQAPRLAEEWHLLNAFYLGRKAPSFPARAAAGVASRLSRWLTKKNARSPAVVFSFPEDASRAFDWCGRWLEEINQRSPGRLIRRDPGR
ncbi:MAG: glycosyltransferase [bacterium]|nr:glycosyltransferase [bacterium]